MISDFINRDKKLYFIQRNHPAVFRDSLIPHLHSENSYAIMKKTDNTTFRGNAKAYQKTGMIIAMKQVSFLRKLTAAVLSCMLCCTGKTIPAFSADETAELPARFD